VARIRSVDPAVWAVVALTVLAGAIRFASLSGQSFWLDESYALGDIRFHSLSGMLDWMRVHEMTPPLYFLLARAWTHVFGTAEVGFRSLSALLGTAVVPLVYATGVALRSRRLGLIVAAFAAVNPLLLWYSQEGRNYALVLFLAAVAFLAFARLVTGAGTAWLAAWWVASALLLGTHYFAIFFVGGLAAVLLWRLRSAAVVGSIVALGVVEVLILPYALAASAHVGFDPIREIPVAYRIAQVPSQFAWGPVEGRFGPWAMAAAVVVLSALAAALALRSRDGDIRRAAAVAGGALLMAVGLPVAVTAVGIDYLTPRYLIPAWIPLAFVWAAPLAAGRRRWILAAGVFAAMAVASVYLLASPAVQRADWRSVARALGPARAGDRAVVAPRLGVPLRLYLTPRELDHGLAPSRLTRATVSEIAVVGTEGTHRQGCWWGGACQLPSRLEPRLVPPAPGFRLVRTQTVGRFRLAVFRAPGRRTLRIDAARLYVGHAGLGLFSFVQHPGPIAPG
jgi:mannosyltransferase